MQNTDIELNVTESYEETFGKGILLFIGLTTLFYFFMGHHNVSWEGMDKYKIWLMVGILFVYTWHFKLVFDQNEDKILYSWTGHMGNMLYVIISYSFLNILVATGFSAQYLLAFGMYQALLINGYTGSTYYKGLTQLKEDISNGHLANYARQILEKNKNNEKENSQEKNM